MSQNLGNLSDLIQYFNINKKIFQKQRNNKQHMQRIMQMLTQQNMKILQKQFQLYSKGLQLPTFIYLMKKLYIPQNQQSKFYFVSDLIKFFQAIDVNGDGHLQWSQFTQYIIQNIRRVQKPNYKNKSFQQNQIISSAYSKISNQYKIQKVIQTSATNNIKKIIYLSKQQKYYVLQTGSNSIKIFNSDFYFIDSFILKGQSQSSYIVDFSFDQVNQIFCALFQSSARFCNIKMSGTIKFMNQVQQKKLRYYHKVEYLHQHKYWVFMSKNGQVKYSTVYYKSRTQMVYTCEQTVKMHDGLITGVSEIQQPKYVVTCGMDGMIKLYSILLKKSQVFQHIAEQTNSIINNKNKKGILGIDYTRQFGSYILSYGFNTNIFIYSLDISLTKGYTGKYSQHTGNMIAAGFLKAYPYVLSFDDKLNLRIWDYRTFQTIQIINCEKNFINPTRVQIIPQLSQCLICQKRITQFRAPSLQKKSKQINEFYNIFDFKICSMTNNIFVFTSNDVRVYHYITGSLLHVFTKLDQNSFQTNITAAQFGYKSRKFFLGDAAGYVRQFDSQTGEFLQQIKPIQSTSITQSLQKQYQNKAIIKIIFLKQHSLLIVCSQDGRIMIYQRNSQSQFMIIRDIRQSHEEVTSAAASVRYCLLAVGSQEGTVSIWNLQKFSLESVLVMQNKIVNIIFSPIHPIMLVVQNIGVISFFYVRPYENTQMRYKCFLKVENIDIYGKLQEISSFSFDLIINAYFNKKCSLIQSDKVQNAKHHFIITIGQKNGIIVQANLNEIIQKFKIQQNHQIFNTKKSIRCQIQNAKTLVSNQRSKILQLQGYSNMNIETVPITYFSNIKSFQASSQQISQLLLVKQNSIILSTSSFDKKLKLFSLQGQLNGSIDFFTFKKISWRLSQVNFHKKIQAIQTCIYAIKLIENRKFTQKQQQDIKVNILINQFMDEKQRKDYQKWIKVAIRNRNNNNLGMRKRNIRIGHKKKQQQKEKQKQKQNLFIPKIMQSREDNNNGTDDSDNQSLQNFLKTVHYKGLQRPNVPQTVLNSDQDILMRLRQNQFQSISNKQFQQIYKKLHNKISKKLSQDNISSGFLSGNNNYVDFSTIDLNKYVPLNCKKSQKKYLKNLQSNNYLKPQHNNSTSSTKITQFPSQLITLPKQRIITSKQQSQYEHFFIKTLQFPKTQLKKQKKSNILYQNLTDARRKIDMMTTMISGGKKPFRNHII